MAAFYELRHVKALPRRSPLEQLYLRLMEKRYKRNVDNYGSYVPLAAKIGPGLVLKHGFHGIHIGSVCEIGDNCTILQGVTIGKNITSDNAFPVIGNDVFIGPMAQIIGNCTIGDGAKIGAGVVLVNADVPAGSVVVNPAAYDLTAHRPIYPRI